MTNIFHILSNESILSENSKKESAALSRQTAELLNIQQKKCMSIRFGCRSCYANIEFDDTLKKGSIRLSKDLTDNLYIPLFPDYEVAVRQNEMLIGPFIGLLYSKEDKNLSEKALNHFIKYMGDYQKINGAVVIFTLDQVDKEKLQINGYCYHPGLKTMQKGVFPYPSSIYRTVGLSSEWKAHFLSVLGDTIFNSRYFSKWEMHRWFQNDKKLSSHIPETALFKGKNDVLSLLNRHGCVYMKPVLGLQGRGILKICKNQSLYHIEFQENGELKKDSFQSSEDLSNFIEKRLHSGKYLIQQAVRLIQFENGPVDFRCVMQKDLRGEWECRTVIGRRGKSGSIVSNISSGGSAFRSEDIIKKALSASDRKAERIKSEIESFALEICAALDDYGINCGTLGIDIGLDQAGFLWLFEINNRDPDPTIALDINDKELYRLIKSGPLYYAKHLSGF